MERIIILLSACVFLCFVAAAQPGVSQATYDEIRNASIGIYGSGAGIDDVVNVDTAVARYDICDGRIENEHALLTHAYVFAGKVNFNVGFVGIYRSNQIAWISDTAMIPGGPLHVFATRDMLHDGSVEIIVIGGEQGGGDISLFRWDGLTGTMISSVNDLYPAMEFSGDLVRFADVEGDGVLELQSYDSSDSLVTFGWNGQSYGRWQTTPQPLKTDYLPMNRFTSSVSTEISNVSGHLRYRYRVQNGSASLQSIKEVVVKHRVDPDSITNQAGPAYWWGYAANSQYPSWENVRDRRYWDILPGKTDSSFAFSSSGLPAIVPYYLLGRNAESSSEDLSLWEQNILNNSVHGLTVAPATPPSPFGGLNFLDTIKSYINQSRSLGWIANQTTANKYLSLMDSARHQIERFYSDGARVVLDTVLQNLGPDSVQGFLTSEAYALIRFNPEYLRGHLTRSFTLSVTIAGSGTVTRVPGNPTYDSASTVQLAAVPSSGNYFINWSGDASDTAHSITVTMNGNKSITAHFLDDLGLATASESSSMDATATNNARHVAKSKNYFHQVIMSGRNVFYRRSNDGGSTWDEAMQVTTNGSNFRPCLVATQSDGVGITWQRLSGSTYEIWQSTSPDEGVNWSTPQVLPQAGSVSVSTYQTEGPTPVIAELVGSQNSLVVVYSSSQGLRYRTSQDGGSSWQVPTTEIISGQYNDHVRLPSLSSGDPYVSLLYEYAEKDNNPWSRIFDGTNWSSEASVGKGTSTSDGQTPSVATDPDKGPVAAWTGVSNSWVRTVVFRMGYSDNTWSNWFVAFGHGSVGRDWLNPSITYYNRDGRYAIAIVNHSSSNEIKLIQYIDNGNDPPSWQTSTLSQSGAWAGITQENSKSGMPIHCWTDQTGFPYAIITGSSSQLSPQGVTNPPGVAGSRRAVLYQQSSSATLTLDVEPMKIVGANGDTSLVQFKKSPVRGRERIVFSRMWDYLGSGAVRLPANARRLVVSKNFSTSGPSMGKRGFYLHALSTTGTPIALLDSTATSGTVSLDISAYAGTNIILRPQVTLPEIDPSTRTVGVGDVFMVPDGQTTLRSPKRK